MRLEAVAHDWNLAPQRTRRTTENRSWSAVACCRFGRVKNPSLRKRVAGMPGLFGVAKAVATYRTP
jgi:hypothetical protein